MTDPETQLKELLAKIEDLRAFREQGIELDQEAAALEKKAEALREKLHSNLSGWQNSSWPEQQQQPWTISVTLTDFILHGDGSFAMTRPSGGIPVGGRPVTVLGHQKGRDTKENIARNYGMPHRGVSQALRLMEQAEKFQRPIICFIDTRCLSRHRGRRK